MARTISTTAQIHRVGIEEFYEQYNEGLTSIWKEQAPKSTKTTQAYIQIMQQGDFGFAPIVEEDNPINPDDIFFGNLKNIAPVKRGLGFDLSTESQETDQYGRLMNIVKSIKEAFNGTREQASANRINNATSTSQVYVGPDGLPLASAAHTADGVTQSNIMTSLFGPGALEDMIASLILTLSHRGRPAPKMGPFDLFIHPKQDFLAQRTLFSEGQQGTPNNDVNRVGMRMRKLIANPYFTNTTFWALRDSGAKQPFQVLERRAIRVREQEDIDLDIIKYRLTEIYAFYESGWRGFFYSTGAG